MAVNAAHPLAVSAAIRDRPDPRNTCVVVYVGDQDFTAECTVSGRYRPAVTQADPEYCYPEEFPEVEVIRLWLTGPWRDVSGMLEDARIAEELQEQCDQYIAERENDGPDPDELRDAWLDRQREDR